MRNYKYTLYAFCLAQLFLFTGCTSDEDKSSQNEDKPFRILTEVVPFEGEAGTRTSIKGTTFENGDRMVLKIICPFVSTTEYGETTHGNSRDGLWLQKWNNGNWTQLVPSDNCDIDGDYNYSYSSNLTGQFDPQQTPYVFTCNTWSQEKRFLNKNKNLILQFAHVFYADQSREKNYKDSDLLWAQSIMQTGTDHITLSFEHKMASLVITINGEISNAATLTLENMPDIDMQEVVVGNYYAPKAKAISGNEGYGYKRCSSTYENNGKVIGVAINKMEANKCDIVPMTGNPNPAYQTQSSEYIANTGVYTAFRENNTSKVFRLIVPPCKLTTKPVVRLCDGDKRYTFPLQIGTDAEKTVFAEGKQYTIKLTIPTPAPPEPEPNPDPDTNPDTNS